MSLLTVEGLTHRYGDKTILHNVSFQLSHKEHVGLVGANGAGKSTLIDILSGHLLHDDGRVSWLPGTEVGYLHQHAQLQRSVSIRGFLKSAFSHLYSLECELQSLFAGMERAGHEGNESLEQSLRRVGYIQEELDRGRFYELDAYIERVASGLGLTELGLDKSVDELSGGQRTKVLLAQLLLCQPKVLLLDEPTNFLDATHVEWLTGYLREYPNAFLVVSHDRCFLNRIVNVILHLEHQRVTRYPGNVDTFDRMYELQKNQAQIAYQRQQEEIHKLETYIQKNKVRASTAKQAKSREKRLGKIERIGPPRIAPKPQFRFTLREDPTATVLRTVDLVVGYESPLFQPLNLELKRGAKVAVTGINGAGKTTLLKSVLGLIPSIRGMTEFGERVCPAYFEQENTEEATHSPVEEIWSLYPGLTSREVREALARCGIAADKAMQPMHTLSGGEQAKVRLCRLMLCRANWLVLDEPTNHLDAAAKASLQHALIQFEGTVLLVTHEPEFYQSWATDVWCVENWKR